MFQKSINGVSATSVAITAGKNNRIAVSGQQFSAKTDPLRFSLADSSAPPISEARLGMTTKAAGRISLRWDSASVLAYQIQLKTKTKQVD